MWYVIFSNDLLLIGQPQELAYNFIESSKQIISLLLLFRKSQNFIDLKNLVTSYKPGTCTLMR